MTNLAETAFAPLEAEGRLVNPVFKGPTRAPGRFGFRGELALNPFCQRKATRWLSPPSVLRVP